MMMSNSAGGGGNNGGTASRHQPSSGEAAAATRLRRLQRLCSRTNGDDGALPDALVFVGGIDGKFNHYSQAVLKFLFLGTTGRDLRNTEINLEHEALEDCVIVVRRHDVHVLYGQAAEATVLPVIARWPRCQEYVLPAEDGDDNDLFELHKVRAFRRMVLSVASRGASLGIPFPRGCDDFRDIEMWPLVQSFALECGGGQGIDQGGKFLSMQYKIIDISSGLLRVFGSVDALAVEACVLRGAAGLANHLAAMRRVLDKARDGAARSTVSEEDLVAPLKLLHDFGVMQDDDAGQADQSSGTYDANSPMEAATHPKNATARRVYPRVFLGARTAILRDRNARSSAIHTVKNTGFGVGERRRRHAEHFVVEAEEPSTGLCICRTHFLATRGKTVVALVRAYRALCTSLPTVVTACSSQWGTVERAEDQTFTVTSPSVASLNKADPGANWRLEASVRAINACRSPILGKSGDSSTGIDGSCIMYVKLVLSGSRGAVAVGDSYAILPTDGRAEGRADGGPSTPAGGTGRLLLTGPACSAYVAVWGAAEHDEDEEETCVPLMRALQDSTPLVGRLALGTPLCSEGGAPHGEVPALAIFPDLAFSAVEGKLRLFSEGFSFHAAGCLPAVVSMRSAINGLSPAVSAGMVEIAEEDGLFLLLVKFAADSSSESPLAAAFPFLESTEAIAIPLVSNSALMQDVLQAFNSWKEIGGETNKIGHLGVADVPDAVFSALRAAPIGSMFDSSAAARERVVRVTAAELSQAVADASVAEGWAEYLFPPESKCSGESGGVDNSSLDASQRRDNDNGGNFSATGGIFSVVGGNSSVVGGKFPAEKRNCSAAGKKISSCEGDFSATGSITEGRLRTTVLIGLPGSGVLSLAAAVLRFSSGGADWTPIIFNPSGEGIDEQEFAGVISAAVEGARFTPKTRVLVAVSAEVSAAAVCAMVARWRNASWRLRIECCTTCVPSPDANPGQGGEERWLPFLVDQCAFGWTSNVVLVSDDGGHRPTTWAHKHHLRRRLYLANPGLSFIAGCSGVCVGQEALESILREDAFDTKVMLQARIDTFGPSWASLRFPGTRNPRNYDLGVDGCPPCPYPAASSSSNNDGSPFSPSFPLPLNGEKDQNSLATRSHEIEAADRQANSAGRGPREIEAAGRQSKSRKFRNLGALETWKIVPCLSTLFPKTSIQMAGFLTEGLIWAEPSAVTLKSHGAEEKTEEGVVRVSGIQRSVQLARSKAGRRQRHAQEVERLNLVLRRWRKERDARDGSNTLSDSSTNYCGANRSSVVGLVKIQQPTVRPKDGWKMALVEATPLLVTVIGIKKGVFNEMIEEVDGELVVRARSGEEVDAMGRLLEVACTPPTPADGRHVRKRSDMSASELEALAEEHKFDPLPQGWLFDGAVFIDYDGNRSTERPDMPEIIDRHLEALNEALA